MRPVVAWFPGGGQARRSAPSTVFIVLLTLSAHVVGDGQLLGSVEKMENELGEHYASGPRLTAFLDDSELARQRQPLSAGCDLWAGRWVYDASYPLYDPLSCPWNMFPCVQRGRRDTLFTRFRWQPHGCNIPRLTPSHARELLRGRRVIFYGDSLARNHFSSFLCMLSGDLPDKNSTVEEVVKEVYNRMVYKFHGFNFTIEHYFSSFLVEEHRAPNVTFVGTKKVVWEVDTESIKTRGDAGSVLSDPHLGNDKLILIVNTGHWWSEGGLFQRDMYFLAPGSEAVNTSMSVLDGFRASMGTVIKWMGRLKDQGASVFWRTYSPTHFMGGGMMTGSCNVSWPRPGPIDPVRLRQNRSVPGLPGLALSMMEAAGIPVLDIEPLSSKRQDGHPGNFYAARNLSRADCSHWCLPGVPDTWTELFIAHLIAHNVLGAEHQ